MCASPSRQEGYIPTETAGCMFPWKPHGAEVPIEATGSMYVLTETAAYSTTHHRCTYSSKPQNTYGDCSSCQDPPTRKTHTARWRDHPFEFLHLDCIHTPLFSHLMYTVVCTLLITTALISPHRNTPYLQVGPTTTEQTLNQTILTNLTHRIRT